MLLISASQFGLAFSFNFVMVFLPFYVHRISKYSSAESLVWIGLIMGAPSFASAVFSTFWGALTNRFQPKLLYMRGLLSHTVTILLMGFATSLPLLLALRILQGILGGISTVGLVIVSASSNKEYASRDIGLFQNSMTLAQLIGPPVGALAAATFGYRGAFVSASALIFLTLVFCFFQVADVPHRVREEAAARKNTLNRLTLPAWGLCFAATAQLMFLPSVLPNVFEAFDVERAAALKWAGFVVMFYTATAMLGTYLFCRLAARVDKDKVLVAVCLAGILLQVSYAFAPGVVGFVVLRMLQTAAVAAILPLIFSSFSANLDAKVIGFLNSGRFTGNAMGPIIATSVLAASNLTWLYLTVALISFVALAGFVYGAAGAREKTAGQEAAAGDGG